MVERAGSESADRGGKCRSRISLVRGRVERARPIVGESSVPALNL